MKILLLGGTGAIGNHLVGLLLNDGHHVCVTTRSPKLNDIENLEFIQGDAKNMFFLSEILSQKWDVIVDFMAYKTLEFSKRVKFLLNATTQYVFISSARVYANSEDIIKEDSKRLLDVSNDEDYLKTDEYALTKARQEDLLINSGYKNWTIIRPYITYDNNRLQLGIFEKEGWLYRALSGKTIIFSKDIYEKITTLTHGLDVSKGINAVVGSIEAKGKIFHITSNESITWGSILEIYLDVLEKYLGCRPKVLLLNLKDFTSVNQAKYQIIYDRLYDREFDNSNINMFIDTEEFKNIKIGLKECLEGFLINPNFLSINWKNEALKDRLTKEKTSLKKIQSVKQKNRYFVFRYLLNNVLIKWISIIQQKKMYRF